MGKSKKQSKRKKKSVTSARVEYDKTLPLKKTDTVKTNHSSLSCTEQISRCAKKSCPSYLDTGDCHCKPTVGNSQSLSVTELSYEERCTHDDLCLTKTSRSQIELESFTRPITPTSSRNRRSKIKNANSEESVKFKSEVSALLSSDTFEETNGIKDNVPGCTEVRTEFGKLLVAACKQKLEEESKNDNLPQCCAIQGNLKHVPVVQVCRNFSKASGSCIIKQAYVSESQPKNEETGKEEINGCPNDCPSLESVTKKKFHGALKANSETKKCGLNPDAPQDAMSMKAEINSTPSNPVVTKTSSSIASVFAGLASHSLAEKERGPDRPQSSDPAITSKGIKRKGDACAQTSPNTSVSNELKDNTNDMKELELIPPESSMQNLSGTEFQSLNEIHTVPASVQSDIPPCKRRHKSERRAATKKRSLHASHVQNPADESNKTVLTFSDQCQSAVSKSSVTRLKSVKCKNKDGKRKLNIKTSDKDMAPNMVADSANAPILTRSMIRTPGSGTGLLLPEDVGSSRKRRMETREPRQNMRLEQHACLLWSSEQRRRFQQEHPEAKSDELDEIMRNYWKTMSERECQRYIQRAQNALNDRNGGLRTRIRNLPLCRSSATSHQVAGKGLLKSAQVKSQGQMWNNHCDGSAYVLEQRSKAVQTKLKYLQKNLSRFQYQRFLSEFHMRLAENPQNVDAAQNSFHTWQQQKLDDDIKNIQQQKFSEMALKTMQNLIQDQEKTIKFAGKEHKAVEHRRMLETYEFLINEMVEGTGNCFLGDANSELLTEILGDLEQMEEVEKVPAAEEEDAHASDVEEKLKVTALAKSLSSGTFMTTADTEEDGLPNVGDVFYQKVLLYEASCQPCLHQLPVEDVEDCFSGCSSVSEEVGEKSPSLLPSDIFLMDAFSRILRQLGGVEACCDLNCPSCILTDLLIASKLQQLETGLQLDEEQVTGQNSHLEASEFVFNTEFNDAATSSDGVPPGYEGETSKSSSDHYLVADSDLDGIFGVDTWLTAPIVGCRLQTTPAESCAVLENHIDCEPRVSPPLLDIGAGGLQNIHATSCSDLGAWAFQEDQEEELSFMQVLHESAEISCAVGTND